MSVMETTKTQVTAVPYVVDELCHACHKCLARTVCKSKAIVQLDPDEPPFIDTSRCYGCHLCITTCPHEAIVLGRPFAPSAEFIPSKAEGLRAGLAQDTHRI